MGKNVFTAFTLLCFTGCTTLQPLGDTRPATIQQQVKVGDTVELERMDGTQLVLKVQAVSAETLTGVFEKRRYEIPLSDIKSIGTRTMTTQSKIWTTVGIVAALGAVIIGIGGDDGGGGGGY